MLVVLAEGAIVQASSRLDDIHARNYLTCGVLPEVPGFALRDDEGRYSGFEIDLCRAIATAILGDPDAVRYAVVRTVDQFLGQEDIDVVARRLTWTLRREAEHRLLFSPIVFFDGAGFLVRRTTGFREPQQLDGRKVCVRTGSEANRALVRYFEANSLRLIEVTLTTLVAATRAFARDDCDALVGDISELAALRVTMDAGDDAFDILDERISKEPLALVVRQGDDGFFLVVRWTVLGLIAAEEAGISSTSMDALMRDDRRESDGNAQRLADEGVDMGRGLGLNPDWLLQVVRSVGNYGEIYDRNLGTGSAIGLERGLNDLWTEGGLMYAPPLH